MGTASFSTFSRPYSRINSSARRTVAGSANMFGLLPARCPPPAPLQQRRRWKIVFCGAKRGKFCRSTSPHYPHILRHRPVSCNNASFLHTPRIWSCHEIHNPCTAAALSRVASLLFRRVCWRRRKVNRAYSSAKEVVCHTIQHPRLSAAFP